MRASTLGISSSVDDPIHRINVSRSLGSLLYAASRCTGHDSARTSRFTSLKQSLGVSATIQRLPEQPGDVPQLRARIDKARALLRYTPRTSIDDGFRQFAEWLTLSTPSSDVRWTQHHPIRYDQVLHAYKVLRMKRRLLNVLACPECAAPFDVEVDSERDGEIESGSLFCRPARHAFPISKSIPRFVESDRYASSFSKQRLYVRKHFKHYRVDSSGDRLFLSTTGFRADAVARGWTLEAGCGYGRYLDVVSRSLGGEIVGVDLSTHSAELAQDFVGNRPNVHVVQCDLFHLPFRRAAFDHVFSIGVLHHTPNARLAFAAIAPYLSRGGQVSVWLYPPGMNKSANRWRVVTSRLPEGLVYRYCVVNQALFSWIRRTPVRYRFNEILPGCVPTPGHTFWLRVMSDFDALTPRYATTHPAAEVEEWFREAGLVRVQSLPRETAVTGFRDEASDAAEAVNAAEFDQA
jgi:uncharacterized protein YbaR (Trm112 family)